MTAMLALLLVVKVFDRSGESLQDRKAAVRTADGILRQAEVTPRWVDCSADAAVASPVCAAPIAPGELGMRITAAPPEKAPMNGAAQSHRSLGYSLVEPERGAGTLGTVFNDRVHWLATAAGTSRQVLLGRAIAHEIGHLLIGTNQHSGSGLMRAVWTTKDLKRDRREDWLFSTADITRLRNSRLGGDDGSRVAEGGAAEPQPEDNLLIATFD